MEADLLLKGAKATPLLFSLVQKIIEISMEQGKVTKAEIEKDVTVLVKDLIGIVNCFHDFNDSLDKAVEDYLPSIVAKYIPSQPDVYNLPLPSEA
jgi:hypothetical protein